MTREEAQKIVDEKANLKLMSNQDKLLLLKALQVLANNWSKPE
jgi:hypothetical protein